MSIALGTEHQHAKNIFWYCSPIALFVTSLDVLGRPRSPQTFAFRVTMCAGNVPGRPKSTRNVGSIRDGHTVTRDFTC